MTQVYKSEGRELCDECDERRKGEDNIYIYIYIYRRKCVIFYSLTEKGNKGGNYLGKDTTRDTDAQLLRNLQTN
jgi:hypothetical protein